MNIVWKEKKGRLSNCMILIHSNVSKFFKKQIINTLHCFPRRSLDEMRTLWMDENG